MPPLPLQLAVSAAAFALALLAASLLCASTAGPFVRFAVAMPRPPPGLVLELAGGEAGVRQQFLAAVGAADPEGAESGGAAEGGVVYYAPEGGSAAGAPRRLGGYTGLMPPQSAAG